MFNFENFISEDFPFCLYCGESCTISNSSFKFTSRNTFRCPNCFENFEKNYAADELYNISFSCRNIIVDCEIFPEENFWYIKTVDNSTEIRLPNQINFDIIDFKNKEILHNKLRTYLIFL